MLDSRPWLKNYPNGVPANIDPTQFDSLVDFMAITMQKYKSNPAYSCMGKMMTFGELDARSDKFGAYLQSRGLKPGSKIALMMPNLLQYPIALIGALKAGLVVVNTNPLYTPREMLHQLTDSESVAIVIAENFASKLESILTQTSIKTVIVTSIGELLGTFKGAFINFAIRKLKRMVPAYNIQNTVSFKEALKQGKRFSLDAVERCPEDVIFLQYTGGTTGVSKGTMLTNENMIANMLQIRTWIGTRLEDGKETALSPLPMYHIFALAVNMMAMMSLGGHTILVVNARDLGSVVKAFKKYPISLMTGVNTLFNALNHNNEFKDIDFSPLKVTVGGGMAVQKSVAAEWEKITGCQLSEGYGMTEASPVICVNPIEPGTGRPGSIGLPVASTDVRIVGDDGTIMKVGESGEIQVKGPQVMKGYYKRPDETANALKGDWLCTGDIGMMDADGFFKIVDRKKDMILVSGFNVFPNEIEEVVSSHESVLESACIGIPDDKSGEIVKIYIVKKDASLTENQILDYCRENLTGYKVPKIVEFRESLPKTNVGKILRRALKEEL